ncbi:MAG: AAA family ATPase [Spirochaetales bacterium]|nr:AAA family ATPase [Spirochaetales bacterium]
MKIRYALSSITIARAPGFGANQFPVIEEFSDSLNIIHGPNGVGKSTLLRNLRALIYQHETDTRSEAYGRLRIGEDVWELERSGKVLKQLRQRDGVAFDLPGVNEKFRESYWFALHELVAPALQDHTAFFEEAKRQMQGGIDFDQAERELNTILQFQDRRLNEAKAVLAAKEKLDESKKRIRETKELGDELQGMKIRLEDRPNLQARKKRLEEIRSYLKQKQAYEQQEAEIHEYDERLASLRNTSLDALSNLEKAVANAQNSVDAKRKEIAEHAQALEELSVPMDLLEDKKLADRLEDELEEAKNLQGRLRDGQEELLKKRGELESWNEQHAWLASEPPEEEALKEMLSSLGRLARTDEALVSAVRTNAGLLKRYPKLADDEKAERKRLIERKNKLFGLATGKRQATKGKETPYRILLVLIVLVMGGIGIYRGVSGFIRGAVILSAISFASLIVLGVTEWNAKRNRRPGTSEFLDSFDDMQPSATADQILHRYYAKLAELDERMKIHDTAQAEFEETAKRYNEHIAAYRETYDALGIPHDPTLEGARFFNVGEHLRIWSGLLGTVRSLEAKVADLQASFDRRIEAVEALCGCTFGHDPVREANRFLDRLKQAQAIKGALERYHRSLEESDKQLAIAKDDRSAWYERHGIESREVAETLFSRIEEYKSLADELELQRRALAKVDETIVEEARDEEPQTFDSEFDTLQQELVELEELYKRSIEIQERHRLDSRASGHEKALHEYESAVEALDAHRRDALKKRLAHSIIADLKEETERDHQPEVIRRSSEWLLRITHNRYSLNAGKEDFRAFDHAEDRSLALEELSSGTRIQVLFALRMGYLETLEEGSNIALPIFFDEIMANSDDERSLAIAEAIGSIAEERQVFYATAQTDEVVKLKRQAETPPRLIDLEQLRLKEAVERRPFTAPKIVPRKEIPFEEEYHQYAKTLKIAQADLFTPVEQLSAWYLCLDSAELHELLMRNLDKAGTARISTPPLSRRFLLLKEAQRLARTGREKTLTPADLGDPGLAINKSTNYYQSIVAFVQRNKVTGSGLLQAIADKKEIKNISADTLQTITEWLVRNSFLSEENAHTKEEIISLLSVKHEDVRIGSDEQFVVERYLSHILDA